MQRKSIEIQKRNIEILRQNIEIQMQNIEIQRQNTDTQRQNTDIQIHNSQPLETLQYRIQKAEIIPYCNEIIQLRSLLKQD